MVLILVLLKSYLSYLKDESASVGHHGNSKDEEQDADASCELSSSRSQKVRPHVDNASDKALHNAKFTVNSNCL